MKKTGYGLALLALAALPALSMAADRDYGVDVSHFQGSSGVSQSTWNSVKSSGDKFAYIKATEGLTNADDATMATNVARATAAGLLTGVYHYAHPENRNSTAGAIAEADHFLDYAGSAIGAGHLRPAMDVEGSAYKIGKTALTSWVIAFCDEIVSKRGSSAMPIIYCDQSYASSYFGSSLANYDAWIADYSYDDLSTESPGTGIFNNWTLWQYSSSGVSGNLTSDVDVVHSDYKTLNSLLITVPEPGTALIGLLGLLVRRRRA